MTGTAAPIFAPISYERFLADVEAVARALEADSWAPDFLVGIGRGGRKDGGRSPGSRGRRSHDTIRCTSP